MVEITCQNLPRNNGSAYPGYETRAKIMASETMSRESLAIRLEVIGSGNEQQLAAKGSELRNRVVNGGGSGIRT